MGSLADFVQESQYRPTVPMCRSSLGLDPHSEGERPLTPSRVSQGFARKSEKGLTPKSADGGDRTAPQGYHESPQVKEYAPHDTR